MADDGVGGADPRGSGLIGLKDRVEALGGHMDITSRDHEGTTLTAEIPFVRCELEYWTPRDDPGSLRNSCPLPIGPRMRRDDPREDETVAIVSLPLAGRAWLRVATTSAPVAYRLPAPRHGC